MTLISNRVSSNHMSCILALTQETKPENKADRIKFTDRTITYRLNAYRNPSRVSRFHYFHGFTVLTGYHRRFDLNMLTNTHTFIQIHSQHLRSICYRTMSLYLLLFWWILSGFLWFPIVKYVQRRTWPTFDNDPRTSRLTSRRFVGITPTFDNWGYFGSHDESELVRLIAVNKLNSIYFIKVL